MRECCGCFSAQHSAAAALLLSISEKSSSFPLTSSSSPLASRFHRCRLREPSIGALHRLHALPPVGGGPLALRAAVSGLERLLFASPCPSDDVDGLLGGPRPHPGAPEVRGQPAGHQRYSAALQQVQ